MYFLQTSNNLILMIFYNPPFLLNPKLILQLWYTKIQLKTKNTFNYLY